MPNLNSALPFVLLVSCAIAPATANEPGRESLPPDVLGFATRVEAQAAVERVYRLHREPAGSTSELPRVVLEAKVLVYLKLSALLGERWHTPVTAEALERETRRIESKTRMPERLAEIRHALGDDPILFQECVVRPELVRRMARSFFAQDERIHGAARAEIERVRDLARRGDLDALRREHATERSTIDEPADVERLRSQGVRAAGDVSPVVEAEDGFSVVVADEATVDRLVVERFWVSKVAWDVWWADERTRYDAASVPTIARSITLTATGQCEPDDQWDTGGALQLVPDAREFAVVVWTGSEMIAWGGSGTTRGDAYDPAIDAWRNLSTQNAPEARSAAQGVWTGTEMIVWGGRSHVYPGPLLATGGRYSPSTDTWTPLPVAGAPTARGGHTTVWTGTHMIVWGGTIKFGQPRDEAKYSPTTNGWTPIPTAGATVDRAGHTAIWTGAEMIVWGGWVGGGVSNTGERFNPIAGTWTVLPTTGAPSARDGHSAVWTGDAMIVWGGRTTSSSTQFNDGGVFRVASGWTPVSTVGAPSPRSAHTAVWTGTEMIVWGGRWVGDGGRYALATNTWSPTAVSLTNAPLPRFYHSAVWTGQWMIIHAGDEAFTQQPLVGGARYDPATDTWTPTARTPDERSRHTAVWTGSEMIVWGGDRREPLPRTNSGAIYDPMLDAWTATSLAGAPEARAEHTAVWTGSKMIVWGGWLTNNQRTATGGRYDPALDAWSPTSAIGAPSGRLQHVSVWTGDRMLIWGGTDSAVIPSDCLAEYAQGGARYDPVGDAWTPMTTVDEPEMRKDFDGVWTGTELVIWGGQTRVLPSCPLVYTDSGSRYDPVLDRWRPTTFDGVPVRRYSHRMVWTGDEVLVWGGRSVTDNPGGRYDPVTDQWGPMSTVGQPAPYRDWFSSVWIGNRMVVWGGRISGNGSADGGRYDPATDSWLPTSLTGAPTGRWLHTGVVTPFGMIVWGGGAGGYPTPKGDGGRYGVGASAECDDGNPCTDDSCSPWTGCVHDPNTASCDDGDACTTGDVCGGSACTGSPVICTTLDQCHVAGVCSAGVCSNTTAPDGAACDDGDASTDNDVCTAGQCAGAMYCAIQPKPKAYGYYKQLCKDGHSHPNTDEDVLTEADAVCVGSLTDTFTGIATVEELCTVLEAKGGTGDGYASKECVKGEQALMASALNVCRQRICLAQEVDSHCNGGPNSVLTTVQASLDAADVMLSDLDRNRDVCRDAKCLVREINNGHGIHHTSLLLTKTAGGSVRLTWNSPVMEDGTGEATGYTIWRRELRSPMPFTQIGTTNADTTTFVDATQGVFEYEVTFTIAPQTNRASRGQWARTLG